jgi:hypothetical protein
VIADGAAEHGIASFQGIEDGSLRNWGGDIERDFLAGFGEGAEVKRKEDADHGSVTQQ